MRLLAAAVSVLVLAIAASTAHATFPGLNGRIAYSECSGDTCPIVQLFITNPDGSANSMLVQQPAGDVFDDPEFAPDGQNVAFTQCESGGSGFDCGISMVRADGQGFHHISPIASGTRDSSPAFSPDGSTIVFVRGPSSGSTDGIWAMGADGSGAHQLTDPGPGVDDLDPDVSPDGGSIVFDRFDGSTQRLWIMDSNGAHQHELIPSSTTNDANPSFSPDGRTIAFQRCGGLGSCSIWVVGVDGDGAHDVSLAADIDGEPEFSPDGTQIVFKRRPDPSSQTFIATVSLATGNVNQVTTPPATSDFKPTWGRVPAPAIDSPPTISGTARVGHSLAAAAGATAFGGAPSFQWLRCDSAGNGCAAIAGATGQTYAPTNADAGRRLKVRQRQTSVGGSTAADSAATARVLKEPGARIAATALVSGGRALVKLSCPRTQNGICAGTLTLTAKLTASASRKRTVRAGKAKYRIRTGRRKTVKVRLSRKVLGALAAHNGKLKVRASTVSADAARNKTTVRRTVKLKLKKKRSST